MRTSNEKDSYPWLPPDLLLLFGPLLIAVPAWLLLPIVMRTEQGDPTLLIVVIGLALCGISLLFLARLPLYRQRRFFTFGPGLLDARHRGLYRCAYVFITAAVVLLVVVWRIAV
jgi:hypothetical protein